MSITIVLADDHGIVRDGLRSLLDSHSRFDVIGEFENGRDVIRMIGEISPDIAILDIEMAGGDGIEATRAIGMMDLPTNVLILSMYSDRRHISDALQAGARGFLLKTCAGSELAKAIDTIFAGHRYLGKQIADVLVDDYVDHMDANQDAQMLTRLSRREREVIQLVVEGYSSVEIADSLNLSPSTVDTYRSRIMRKLKITSLPKLVIFAIQEGLISLN